MIEHPLCIIIKSFLGMVHSKINVLSLYTFICIFYRYFEECLNCFWTYCESQWGPKLSSSKESMDKYCPFQFFKGWFSEYGQKNPKHSSKYLLLCSATERKPYEFAKTEFLLLERTIPLRGRPSVDFITTRCLSETSPWVFWGDKVFGGFLFMGFLVN